VEAEVLGRFSRHVGAGRRRYQQGTKEGDDHGTQHPPSPDQGRASSQPRPPDRGRP
jgi:hypothetical protein